MEDNWKWSERASELKLGSFTSADQKDNSDFLKWKKQRGHKTHQPAPQPTTTPTQVGADPKLIKDLEAMGFKSSEAKKALEGCNNHFDKALDKLFSLG